MSAIERWSGAPPELTEEGMERLYERCKRLAKFEKLPKTLKGKPDNVMAVALTINDLGMPVTLTTLRKFHIINDEVVESAQVLLGLAAARGHDIWIEYQDAERAIVKGRRAGGQRVDTFTFTREQAGTAGLLDHWWEEWYGDQDNRRLRKWVIREGESPPIWVTKEGSKAVKKRNEYWHGWPVDAVTNAALRRAVRSICPDVLLGLPSSAHEFTGPAEPDDAAVGGDGQVNASEQAGAAGSAAGDVTPDGDPPDDEDVVDGEVVEDDDHDQGTEPPAEPGALVGDKWRQTFAMTCNDVGLTADQRHAILHYATSGRTSTSKEIQVRDVPAVREWFHRVTDGDYRFLELDGAVVIAPRSPEGVGADDGQLPLEGGEAA